MKIYGYQTFEKDHGCTTMKKLWKTSNKLHLTSNNFDFPKPDYSRAACDCYKFRPKLR